MRIFQIVQCFDYGDGIGNDIKKKKEMLDSMGIENNIYGVFVDPRNEEIAEHISLMKAKKDDILLIHYSGFCTFLPFIEKADCTKVLIYHNITPPEFFEDEEVKEHCRKGLEQIREVAKLCDYFSGDSRYNVEGLKLLGAAETGKELPIVVEFDRTYEKKAEKMLDRGVNFLFVGRVVPNKRIENVIKIFNTYWHKYDRYARLYLPGNDEVSEGYTAELKELIAKLPARYNIELMGKVSDEKLKNLYLDADLYLSMSEHEGFGIPLLEAMSYDIPVAAYDSAAVSETMGNSGILLKTNEPEKAAKILYTVLHNKEVTEQIRKAQRENLKRFTKESVTERFKELIDIWSGKTADNDEKEAAPEKKEDRRYKTVQMQGPFETSYSLAIVNRKLIEAIDRAGFADCSIHCMEGGGDYEPDAKNMEDKPEAKRLWLKGKGVDRPDVGIRNMYPPTGQPTNAKYSYQSFAWEEDRIPKKYIDDFNRTLTGIGTTADFVTDALKASGLKIPVRTIGNGVEIPENYDAIEPFKLGTEKSNIFLHISSCFPRKGVDVLLKAYFECFTCDDDVCLVIKTFPNPHNKTEEQLNELKEKYGEKSPEVIFLNYDMPTEELYSLYKAASCYVHSARGEGFGLPVAEAMLARLPVIACNNTGLADFTNEETALVFGFTKQPAKSHLAENSNWFEPDEEGLKKQLKAFVYERASLDIEGKTERAYKLISEKYSWDAVALRWRDFLDETVEAVPRMKIGMVSTWNVKCGIAEFTRMQMSASDNECDYTVFPDRAQSILRDDESYVAPRTWGQFDKGIDELIAALKESDSEVIELQYNFAFYSVESLGRIIDELRRTKPVVVHLHSSKYFDDHINKGNARYIKKTYNKAAAFIVHQQEDIPYLTGHGVKRSLIKVVPLGQLTCPDEYAIELRERMGIAGKAPVIASYGFLLPNKGVEKTIRAVAILKRRYPDILFIASCAMFALDISREYYEKCLETIEELGLEENVVMIPDYLEPEQSFKLLHAADICTMLYDPTHETSSGAVRFCAAALRPILTTRQNIFKEFEEGTYQIEDNEPETIAKGLTEMIESPGMRAELVEKLKIKINEISWKNVGPLYSGIYREIINGKR